MRIKNDFTGKTVVPGEVQRSDFDRFVVVCFTCENHIGLRFSIKRIEKIRKFEIIQITGCEIGISTNQSRPTRLVKSVRF